MKVKKGCLKIVLLCCLTASYWAQAGLDDLDFNMLSVNGAEIAWAETGNPLGEPLIMIAGLGSSHRVWGNELIDGLSELGYRIILLDNRDVGLSQRMDEHGNPVIWWNYVKKKLGFNLNPGYTLEDMANDVVMIMNEVGLKDAHVFGASMGGMIAQTVAYKYPKRVRSLISVMSSTGAPHLPSSSDDSSNSLTDIADTDDPKALAELNNRGFYPSAMPRQILAIIDAGDRSEAVEKISVSTLVIHGVEDTLLPLPHGEHTASLIKGSRFVALEGMGHDIPSEVMPKFLNLMLNHLNNETTN